MIQSFTSGNECGCRLLNSNGDRTCWHPNGRLETICAPFPNDPGTPLKTKKADAEEHWEVFLRVGLLINEPPGPGPHKTSRVALYVVFRRLQLIASAERPSESAPLSLQSYQAEPGTASADWSLRAGERGIRFARDVPSGRRPTFQVGLRPPDFGIPQRQLISADLEGRPTVTGPRRALVPRKPSRRIGGFLARNELETHLSGHCLVRGVIKTIQELSGGQEFGGGHVFDLDSQQVDHVLNILFNDPRAFG